MCGYRKFIQDISRKRLQLHDLFERKKRKRKKNRYRDEGD